MNWELLINLKQMEQLKDMSFQLPVLFFKHSTRCSISTMVLKRFEREWNGEAKLCFLDLLKYRAVSNQISEQFGVEHQSPQVLLIKDGVCVFHASHNAIDAQAINDSY